MICSRLLPKVYKAETHIERWYVIRQKASHYRVSLLYHMRSGLPCTTIADGSWYALTQRRKLWWWQDESLHMLPGVLGLAIPEFRKIVAELTNTVEEAKACESTP